MESADLASNTDSLLELNPKLADVSHHTRIAYAKFMTTKIKKEIKFEDNQVTIENEKKTREREMAAFTKFRTKTGILKKQREEAGSSSDLAEPDSFRARTPIEEDPNEDIQTPDRPSTPENILDEPVPPVPSPVTVPTTSPSPSPESSEDQKPESPMVKTRSMSIISEQSEKSVDVPMIKTPDLKSTEECDESEEEEEEEKPKASTHLNVPSPTPNRPISPSLSSGDKGKSKITGKTLTGWI